MKLLLAGPGTGKTTKIKELIENQQNTDGVLILSFTNATIDDLLKNFEEKGVGIDNKQCMTLHKYAFKLNYQKNLHVMDNYEESVLKKYAKKFGVNFNDLSRSLESITFEQMILQTIAYIKANPTYFDEFADNIKLLIVDEYQDFNSIERELIDLIAARSEGTIILGDDNQSIYDFKDADIDGIIDVYNNQGVEKIQHHNICYRCPDSVVDACSSLIENNQKRIQKDWKKNKKDGDVVFKQIKTQVATATYIANEIAQIKKVNPDASFMILSPVKFASEDIIIR